MYILNKETIDADLCFGCLKVDSETKCSVYEKPSVWVRKGDCPMKTNKVLLEVKGKKINPLKASKRKKRGK